MKTFFLSFRETAEVAVFSTCYENSELFSLSVSDTLMSTKYKERLSLNVVKIECYGCLGRTFDKLPLFNQTTATGGTKGIIIYFGSCVVQSSSLGESLSSQGSHASMGTKRGDKRGVHGQKKKKLILEPPPPFIPPLSKREVSLHQSYCSKVVTRAKKSGM